MVNPMQNDCWDAVDSTKDYRNQSSLYLTNVTYYGIIVRIRSQRHEESRVHSNRLMSGKNLGRKYSLNLRESVRNNIIYWGLIFLA